MRPKRGPAAVETFDFPLNVAVDILRGLIVRDAQHNTLSAVSAGGVTEAYALDRVLRELAILSSGGR